jgi:hypothetical protein
MGSVRSRQFRIYHRTTPDAPIDAFLKSSLVKPARSLRTEVRRSVRNGAPNDCSTFDFCNSVRPSGRKRALKRAACLGLSAAEFESCYCKIRAHPPRVTHLEERDDDKNSQRSRNSVNDRNPGICTSRGSRTWRECFLRELGVVGSGPSPMPGPSPSSSYGSMDHNASNESDAACSQRYRSYDPSSGTFRGYDGARHPCQ